MFRGRLKLLIFVVLNTFLIIQNQFAESPFKFANCLKFSLPFARLQSEVEKGEAIGDREFVFPRLIVKNYAAGFLRNCFAIFSRNSTCTKNILTKNFKSVPYFYSHIKRTYPKFVAQSDYLLVAKRLFHESGGDCFDDSVHRFLIRMAGERVGSKVNTRNLSLVDYEAVPNKSLINTLPWGSAGYHAHGEEVLPHGTKKINKEKFLLCDGNLVGWIKYYYIKSSNNTYSSAYIDYLGVNEKYRSKGYGLYLITYALCDMEVVETSDTELHSVSSAVKFYEKIGFTSDSDSWCMRKKISSTMWPFNIFCS